MAHGDNGCECYGCDTEIGCICGLDCCDCPMPELHKMNLARSMDETSHYRAEQE
jgi:hypothetical protein